MLLDVIERQVAAGDLKGARTTLDRSLASSAAGSNDRLVAGHGAACVEAGRLAEARSILESLEDPMLQAHLCVGVAQAMLEARARPNHIAIEDADPRVQRARNEQPHRN